MKGELNPAAFACASENGHQQGMSLLDYFAGQALAGLLADGGAACGPEGYAHDAYLFAQAMLTERQRITERKDNDR